MSKTRDYEDYTWVATIIGAHGIKGAVRVKTFSDDPEYYLNVPFFYLEQGDQLEVQRIERIYPNNTGWIIQFEEICDRNRAEELKGSRLLLADDALKPLEPDEFFIHDVIGCKVEDKTGKLLGEVTGFLETGANNVFEVGNGKNTLLGPDVTHVVMELNFEEKRMVIDPLPGMMDADNEPPKVST